MELNKEAELISDLEINKDISLVEAKEMIKANIDTASRCFVGTGYYLKYIRDNDLYKEDGYESVWELAQEEFGISKSSASRFMSINDRFSKDGNSPILLDKYKNFSSSKLSEMLTMTDEQIEQVTISTTRAEIREIKKPEKKEVVAPAQQESTTEKPIAAMIDNELIKVKNASLKILEEIKEKPGIAENDVSYPAKQESVTEHIETVTKVDESVFETVENVIEDQESVIETVENVSADIVQTTPEESFIDQCEAKGLKFNAWLKSNGLSIASIVDEILCNEELENETYSTIRNGIISKLITKTEAHYSYLTKELNIKLAQEKPKQPELPILKNNDQRKDFIEAYESWPLWIDLELTGEKYYKYDFDNNTSFVIKVSTRHKWNGPSGYEEEITYGHEKYYILGTENKEKYKPKYFTFCESETNKTALIDYLKEIQKK